MRLRWRGRDVKIWVGGGELEVMWGMEGGREDDSHASGRRVMPLTCEVYVGFGM